MIHGTYHVGNRRVSCRAVYCTTCKSPQLAEGRKSLVILHIAFIPLAPIGTTVRWFCRSCHREADARRPSRPVILLAGVAFSVGMMLLGVSMFFNHEKTDDALGCLVLGLPVLRD